MQTATGRSSIECVGVHSHATRDLIGHTLGLLGLGAYITKSLKSESLEKPSSMIRRRPSGRTHPEAKKHPDENPLDILKAEAALYQRLIKKLGEFTDSPQDKIVPKDVLEFASSVVWSRLSSLLTEIHDAPEALVTRPNAEKTRPPEDGLEEKQKSFQALISSLSDETTRDVWAALHPYVKNLGFDLDEIIGSAFDDWSTSADTNHKKVESALHYQETAKLLRTLPEPEVLEKIQRYESHLRRLMLKDLHELEALQARRFGQTAPLVRFEVNGDGYDHTGFSG